MPLPEAKVHSKFISLIANERPTRRSAQNLILKDFELRWLDMFIRQFVGSWFSWNYENFTVFSLMVL